MDLNTMDGFSTFPQIMTYFKDLANDGTSDDLPRWWNIERSLEDNSPTLIFRKESFTRIAHWAEVDERSYGFSSEKGLLLWPSEALDYSTTYLVVVRSLKNKFGGSVEPSPLFRYFRDYNSEHHVANSTWDSDPIITKQIESYQQVFVNLEKHCVKREDLVLVWEFTTASAKSSRGRLLSGRDDARFL